MKYDFNAIFNRLLTYVYSVIMVFMIIGITIGTFLLFKNFWELAKFKGITGQYINIVADVLTLFVLVELSRSLMEYFNSHKLRLTFIVDAAIVFVIREIMINLYKHKIAFPELVGFSCLLLVLGALRIASIVVYQKERQMQEEMDVTGK